MDAYPVHLVLSSGGIKSLSYIGAIQKLQENNITFASISTCSMASLLGACIASGISLEEFEEKVLATDFNKLKVRKNFLPFIHLKSYPFSEFKTPDFSKIIKDFLGKDLTLGELDIPFATAAVDLHQQRILVYSSDTHPEMKVGEIIKIATAIPPFYDPYEKGKRLLVDAAIASQSPVWIATNYPGNYPIIVLKPADPPTSKYLDNFGKFIGRLFSSSVSSYDHFINSQIPRAIQIDINCGEREALDFDLSKNDIKSLMLEGESAVERKLKDYGGNFNHILDIEEIKARPIVPKDTADRAAMLSLQSFEKFRDESRQRQQVFISYSKEDKPWLQRMQTFMKSVERFTGIKTWDNTEIKGGDEWKEEIHKALRATKVAVFLVSPHFLASDFILDEEMTYFIEISKKEKVDILWVAISSSLYEHTPLKDIKCANDPKHPLNQLPEGKQDEELTNICKTIIDLMS